MCAISQALRSLSSRYLAVLEIVRKAPMLVLSEGLIEGGAMATKPTGAEANAVNALASYLASVRQVKGLTLREVEEATGKEVSNAYLSQLERGKIGKPSPHILHSLSGVYNVAYERLMELAGYISAAGHGASDVKHGRAATFASENLTPDEEAELLKYLGYIRSQKR